MCSVCPQMSETQKGYWKQLESFILDWINEYKNIWGWRTVRNHRKYLQMCYLQGGMGCLKICFPKMGKNRERETQKVEWTSAEIYTRAVWSTASRSEASSHHRYGWPLVKADTTPPAVNLIRQEDIRNLKVISEHHEITSALQSLRTSPSRLLSSILPFWAFRNNLRSLFIDLRCQVVFHVSHISNLVLHHCRKTKKGKLGAQQRL